MNKIWIKYKTGKDKIIICEGDIIRYEQTIIFYNSTNAFINDSEEWIKIKGDNTHNLEIPYDSIESISYYKLEYVGRKA